MMIGFIPTTPDKQDKATAIVVEMDAEAIELLPTNIQKHLGKSIHFSNGCFLCLEDDNGMFEGDTPYNQHWSCNNDDQYIGSIINWLSYWNEARTESGEWVNSTQ